MDQLDPFQDCTETHLGPQRVCTQVSSEQQTVQQCLIRLIFDRQILQNCVIVGYVAVALARISYDAQRTGSTHLHLSTGTIALPVATNEEFSG